MNTRLLTISRNLTPEHKADLLTWVNLAYKAEDSVRKSISTSEKADGKPLKPQDFSCENSLKRREK